MKIATWNVNGIRARFDDVSAWADRERPDVFCLQEIKATPSQVPEPLTGLPDYWSFWHGGPGGYSGVSVHVRRDHHPTRPAFVVPDFDMEYRVAAVELDGDSVRVQVAGPEADIDLSGWADRTVTVAVDGVRHPVRTGDDGTWSVTVAGGTELTIR